MKLIQETSREERQQYIDELFRCHHGDCENCGVCRMFQGASPQVIYQDFIDGKREFQDITKEINQR